MRAPVDRMAGALGAPRDATMVAFGPFVVDWGSTPRVGCALRLDRTTGRLSWQEPTGEQVVTLRRAFVEDGKVFVRTDAGRFTLRGFRNADRRWLAHVLGRPAHDPDLASAVCQTFQW